MFHTTFEPRGAPTPVIPEETLSRVAEDVRRHCADRGCVDGPNWNPMAPRDPVAALAMARRLIDPGRFDAFVAVAPEGHAYGYFFERLGARVPDVSVDYPPRRVDLGEGLGAIRGARVLLIEDDVISGLSLRMVVAALEPLGPRSLSLYLGREKDSQQLENVPEAIARVHLAEDDLDPSDRPRHEAEFLALFGGEPPA